MKLSLLLLLALPLAAQQYAKPNLKLTPGVVDSTLVADLSRAKHIIQGTEHNICAPDFVTPPFRVATKSTATKRKVCEAYGITDGTCPGKAWELDDIIAVETGGKNVATNLWPEPIAEARIKDHRVEDPLGGPRGLICAGKISLQAAQQCELTDWVKCMATVDTLRGR